MKHAPSCAAAQTRLWEEADFKALAEIHAAMAGRNTASSTQIENKMVSQSRSLAAIDAILKQGV
ncbi:hypothetical protein [Sandarakinorhabdus sp.]|uniref:hypothetical protein n=1 Tax=Sandarakinorhabdus sp. TaxID=1916663 RepID=UPI00286E25EE|nr:hypothetical protein [Sandarakinorhabdus sp.]